MTDTVYTEDVTRDVVARYVDAVEAGATYDERTALVAEIAEELQVAATSVRGKLVAEKVYVAKTAGNTRGTRTKADVVKALEAVTGVSLTSFEKATKADLEAMFTFIVTASDEFNADRGLTVPGAE